MDKDARLSPSVSAPPESTSTSSKKPPSPLQSGSMPVMRLVTTPIAPGELVGGRYRVDRVVAEGGMGVIVAAHHMELEERVAIKFLKTEFASKPEIVGRFAREAKAAAKIRCEYTATVLDVGISPERGPYIVMEFLEGEDLERVLQTDGRIPFARATELIMQAGEAIAVAHANGIIHRDLKPANLFLVGTDNVPIIKVLDFGVSKTALTGNMFGGAISLVKTQSLVGSPIYMSPEQLRGNQEVGPPADIWSLGAVLYELVTGSTAFTGSTITELCAAVLESEPVPISDRAPDVPSGLAEAIMRCLDKDVSRRWQSIAELVVALAPYAPKRARMCVDRVVAGSKAAGLIPESFKVPTTLAPPPSESSGPPVGSLALPPPPVLIETQPEIAQASTPPAPSARPALVLADEPPEGGEAQPPKDITAAPSHRALSPPSASAPPRSRGRFFVAGALLSAIGLLGAGWYFRRSLPRAPAPVSVTPAPAPSPVAEPSAGVPSTTAAGSPAMDGRPQAAPAEARVEEPVPAPTAGSAHAARPNPAAKPALLPSAARLATPPPPPNTAWRGAVTVRPPAAKATPPSPTEAPAPGPKKSDVTKSAIDDRK